MKAINNTVTTSKTDKTNKDIRSNALFTDITAEEEVFVRGGRFRAPELLFWSLLYGIID